jgi:hypothetical protein
MYCREFLGCKLTNKNQSIKCQAHNCFKSDTEATNPPVAQVCSYDAKAKNRYGVDMAYFRKEFAKLSRDLDNYTPVELARYLERLVDVAVS